MKDLNAQLSIVMLVFVTYLVSPVLFWFCLVFEFESDSFPSNADSIGIPMAGFIFLWLVGWVILIAVYVVWTMTGKAILNREILEQNAASGVK